MKFSVHFFRGSLFAAASLALVLLGTGCGSVRPETKHSAEVPAPTAKVGGAAPVPGTPLDVLRVGDPITIAFSGVIDAPSTISERIKADGKLRLPLLTEPVQAAGKKRGDLEDEIYRLYVPNLYKRLTVKVGSEGRVVHVRGEVKIPGRVQYLGDMTVLRAIAAAGDFTDFANRRKVKVTRANGQRIVVDCNKAQQDPEKDLPAYPDDLIDVDRRLF